MSETLDTTVQFLSDCAIFVLSQVFATLTNQFVNRISSKISNRRQLFNMYKSINSSNQSSNSGVSGKSIGEKWKSIIGKVDDEPLLEDEDVPEEEFYESSPEMNRFKSVDSTLLEPEPKWRCVSDESFLNMEQMVMSPLKTPLKRITENEREVDTTNLISFSPYSVKETIKEDVETSTADNDYETCESGTSRITDGRKTSQQETSFDYITCDSEASRITDAKPSISWETMHYNTQESCTLTSGHSSDSASNRIKHVTSDSVHVVSLSQVSDATSGHDSDVSSQSSVPTKDDSLLSSQASEGGESLKFNDTLEEMEHLLKYGINYMTASDKPKEKSPVIQVETKQTYEKYYRENNGFASLSNAESDVSSTKDTKDAKFTQLNIPRINLNMYREHKEIDIKSPVTKKTAVKKVQKESKIDNKENQFRLRSPRLVLPTTLGTVVSSTTDAKPWFQPAKKTPTKPRKFFYDTPPTKAATPKLLTPQSAKSSHCQTPNHSTPSKYTNIMSPIQYYIKNSPTIPKIQNVSPGINLWEKQSHRAPYKGKPVKSPKENVTPLQEKAYQQPKTTRVIETVDQRLPKNFKVNLMAENLPKPRVIKHEIRKGLSPLRERNAYQRQGTYTFKDSPRDSYAEMEVKGGEISVCIGKPAVRTHTLK